ncbi:hypothetical protein RHSIM_Rhsim04G0143300 [Rhododendron simsii]|uniref:Integrase catalytic domain-containing protein n=1 Tax=Rhododendron simsii TaxID=118357 RepID=A0A834LMC1_RHOSS|nr:hypothetical protein RHSIM_Rhsim04G0143300 [Rhododendron simsii]
MEEGKEKLTGEETQISLNALTGSISDRTLRVRGNVKKKVIIILIDSGSTHNFLNPEVVKRANIKTEDTDSLPVSVADGPVKWDFMNLSMEFQLNGRKHVLRGGKNNELKIVGSEKMHKLLQKQPHGAVAQICLLQAHCVPREEDTPQDLGILLSEFGDVFQKPKELPPPRSHHHCIPLKPGTEPTNVRPYRYPYFQKTEIEKQVKETLNSGIITPTKGVSAEPTKLQTINSWPEPTNIKELRGFLGITGYYRRFIQNYSRMCSPLHYLLKKDSFVWTPAATTAFLQLKTAMTSTPVLALPNYSKAFVVESDASGTGLGAVLIQDGHPIAYWSKGISTRDQALSTYEKELMAVLKWRHYLLGRHFLIRTDHQSLQVSLRAETGNTFSTKMDNQAIGFRLSYSTQMCWLDEVKHSWLVVGDSPLRRQLIQEFHSSSLGAKDVAKVFFDQVFKLHGLPSTIVSDRDVVLTSHFWHELFTLQGCKLCLSTAYHPQTDGQTEILNKCSENYLRSMTGYCPRQWAKWLPLADWWYDTTYHSATKTTPYFAVYGQEPPDHTFCISKPSSVAVVDNWITERAAIIKHLREHLSQAQHRMKHYADKGRSEREFAVGDWVFHRLQPYKQTTVALQRNMKLAPRFYGPYQVLERVGTVAYKLQLPAAAKIHHVFHVSLLKKKLGANVVAHTTLPPVGPEGALQLEPMAVLDRRMVKRGNKAVIQWLVQWVNSFPEDATWVDHSEIEAKHPQFQPQGCVQAAGNVISKGLNCNFVFLLYFRGFRELVEVS